MKANPEVTSFRWAKVNEAVNVSTMDQYSLTIIDTDKATLSYQRPNDTAYSM